jgi:UDP-3-O-[3-hydroxymyristoyl] glucosamine N-acyltransferase
MFAAGRNIPLNEVNNNVSVGLKYYTMSGPIKSTQIVEFLQSYSTQFDAKYTGDDITITGVNDILVAKSDELAYATSKIRSDIINKSSAGILLVDSNREINKSNVLYTNNPEFAFAVVYREFFACAGTGLHKSAFISDGVQIGENCQIGANVYIGPNVKIEDNVRIAPGAVIGSKGFGYARDSTNELVLLPHEGKVVLENNVEIGANSVIDVASFNQTIVRKGTKIGNLVHVAHNVSIGENTLIAACAKISGSTNIGNNCFIHPCVCVGYHLNVGNNCIVGSNSTVLQDLPDHSKAVGSPAKILET